MPRKSPRENIETVRRKLKHMTLEASPDRWLDTGHPGLNGVLGSAKLGVPYGRIIELFGPASHGKTMLALLLAALAQKDGASVIWADFELSFDPDWAARQGLDPAEVYLMRLEMGRFGKKTGDPRLQTAEEMFQEIEEVVRLVRSQDAERPVILVVDSVAAILVEDEAQDAPGSQTMRTRLSLASFLGPLLRRWAAIAAHNAVMVVFINQVRENPGVLFGNSEYTPGGRSLPFYASVRTEVRRVKGGRIKKLGTTVGLRGRLKNVKNKAGGGSVEGLESGYVSRFESGAWKFPTVRAVQGDDCGEDGETDE